MASRRTVAVLGPIPHNHITTNRGEPFDKYGCVVYTVAALSAPLGPDDLLLDQRGRHFVVISCWESQEAMRASDPQIAPLRAEAAKMLGGSQEVRDWEVAALQRTADLQPGNWVSVACLETAPGNVDRVVDTFRDDVLRAAANPPGCRVAMLLVDRDEGRLASAFTFDSYAALHSARKQQCAPPWPVRGRGAHQSRRDGLRGRLRRHPSSEFDLSKHN